ncbi:MAG: hypothetical protein RLZZ609_2515 [Cyanobacteriota bacterium]|jgi:hypothetical protein
MISNWPGGGSAPSPSVLASLVIPPMVMASVMGEELLQEGLLWWGSPPLWGS